MKDKLKKVIPDTADMFVFTGIGLIGTGTWIRSPSAALIVVGSLLLLLALTPYLADLFKPRK